MFEIMTYLKILGKEWGLWEYGNMEIDGLKIKGVSYFFFILGAVFEGTPSAIRFILENEKTLRTIQPLQLKHSFSYNNCL
jgi:hypothetical protein